MQYPYNLEILQVKARLRTVFDILELHTAILVFFWSSFLEYRIEEFVLTL